MLQTRLLLNANKTSFKTAGIPIEIMVVSACRKTNPDA